MCQHDHYPQRSTHLEYATPPKIIDTRLDKFFNSPYASQHLDRLLDRHRTADGVRLTCWSAPPDTKPPFDEAAKLLEAEGKPIQKGFVFGPTWSNHWIKAELNVSEGLRRFDQDLVFEFDPSCEALIFSLDGTPLHAITGGPNTTKDGREGEQEDRRVEHIIPAEAVRRGSYTVYIEVSCNLMFGTAVFRYQPPPTDRTFPLVSADIVVPNYTARALRNDFRLLTEIARHPDTKTFGLSKRAYKAGDDVMNHFRRVPGDEANGFAGADQMLTACRKIAWKVLGDLDEAGLRKSVVRDTTDRAAKVWAIGHCHIDTAWLWRYTQTQQKVARSWTTQCDLMDRWENHQFAASSAQQYAWLEDLYPKGFARVKQYIEKGRFHAVGGAWLEHDCMLPSGESLCRQYLYGQRYFKSRFGSYCREAWLPDTFGYASQLPQILRLAGLDYFFTQKISWNNINIFPYNTFNWAGIDGTQVLAHMTPVDQYNGQCSFEEIVKAVRNNKNIENNDQALFLFGNGDGGGGPTPLMMEKLARLSTLAATEPSVPAVRIASPIQFFDHLMEASDYGRLLPTWRGELYLEYHRGTYTTQTKIKAGNRDMETLLRDLEYFAAMASLIEPSYEYPQSALDEIWKDVLLGQFHDCLPGTTINSVVLDNLNIYEKRGEQARRTLATALDVLTDSTGAPCVIDPLRLERIEVVQRDGEYAVLRTDATGSGALESLQLTELPSAVCEDGRYVLSNSDLRLVILDGRITELNDLRAGRQLIAPAPGTSSAGLMIYEDFPLQYDAWDVEIYHLKCGSEIAFEEVKAVEDGPRASLICKAHFSFSSATVTISLDASNAQAAPKISVRVEVDWHEKHKILRFVLPVDIVCSYATYATQFGVIERPTHRNTTLDQAKFEVCAHGYADLSEATYGVAIACRDKYGYAVEGNAMRLSLVRAPTSPDPETDQGQHDIHFAIFPHQGQLAQSNIHLEALKHNNQPYYLAASVKPTPKIYVDGPQSSGIILETIKRGEDDGVSFSKSLVLRMYEAIGGRATGTLHLSGLKIKSLEWVNILEEPLPGAEEVSLFGGKSDVALVFKPFELKSLKVNME